MSDQPAISIQFNGQQLEVPKACTVTQLLEIAEIRSQLVAVEINLNIIPRVDHGKVSLQPGDVVEAVTLVGGG
jgi:thiamine biosynthesis protein ThiS